MIPKSLYFTGSAGTVNVLITEDIPTDRLVYLKEVLDKFVNNKDFCPPPSGPGVGDITPKDIRYRVRFEGVRNRIALIKYIRDFFLPTLTLVEARDIVRGKTSPWMMEPVFESFQQGVMALNEIDFMITENNDR